MRIALADLTGPKWENGLETGFSRSDHVERHSVNQRPRALACTAGFRYMHGCLGNRRHCRGRPNGPKARQTAPLSLEDVPVRSVSLTASWNIHRRSLLFGIVPHRH
jgi:hypothetical protein